MDNIQLHTQRGKKNSWMDSKTDKQGTRRDRRHAETDRKTDRWDTWMDKQIETLGQSGQDEQRGQAHRWTDRQTWHSARQTRYTKKQ